MSLLRAPSAAGPWAPPEGDEDAPWAPRLRHEPFLPLFVLGPDPAACAALCVALTRALPVVGLTRHRALAYGRLLSLALRGQVARDRAALAATLPGGEAEADRPVEYGPLLRRLSGRAGLDARSLPALHELGQKLLRVRPRAQAVLLWDGADALRAPELVPLLPGARFLGLRGAAPAADRGYRGWLGRRRAKAIQQAWEAAWRAIPPARRIELDPSLLEGDSRPALLRVGAALGLSGRA